jgi:hypothetical protein
MMDSPSSFDKSSAPRPRLLTVLCYLTMFASSWIMINSLTALMNPEQVSLAFSKELQKIEGQFEQMFKQDPVASERVQDLITSTAVVNSSSNMRDHSLFSLISNVLTFLGASLMLRLKRNGFRLYFFGTVLGVVTPLLVFGTTNLLGLAYSVYAGFFGLIFTILYASKLKYLNQ